MNYDVDLGPALLSDWYHDNPFKLFEIELEGRPPSVDSILLQGKGIYCGMDECVDFECDRFEKGIPAVEATMRLLL